MKTADVLAGRAHQLPYRASLQASSSLYHPSFPKIMRDQPHEPCHASDATPSFKLPGLGSEVPREPRKLGETARQPVCCGTAIPVPPFLLLHQTAVRDWCQMVSHLAVMMRWEFHQPSPTAVGGRTSSHLRAAADTAVRRGPGEGPRWTPSHSR